MVYKKDKYQIMVGLNLKCLKVINKFEFESSLSIRVIPGSNLEGKGLTER